ncbi:hypothetical protein ACVXHB_03405 [Escherichia coli]
MSVAFAACTLARQIFESLSTVTVLLVGAGETIELGGASSARTQSTEDDYRQPHSRTCPNSGR